MYSKGELRTTARTHMIRILITLIKNREKQIPMHKKRSFGFTYQIFFFFTSDTTYTQTHWRCFLLLTFPLFLSLELCPFFQIFIYNRVQWIYEMEKAKLTVILVCVLYTYISLKFWSSYCFSQHFLISPFFHFFPEW